MLLSYRRTLAIAALTVSIPLSIFVACGSSTFTSDDQDGSTVSPQNDSGEGDSQATTSDAGADADAAAPPPPTWCQTNAPAAFLCADFDEGDFTQAYNYDSLTMMFTPTVVDAGTTPGLFFGLGDSGSSPPSALRVFLPAVTSAATQESAQVRTAYQDLTQTTKFEVDFDFRNEAVGNETIASTLTFQLDDKTDSTYGRYELDVTSDGTNFSVDGANPIGLGQQPTLNVWTHFRIDVDTASTGNVSVQVDNNPVVDAGPSQINYRTTAPQLTFGQYCSLPATGQCGMGMSFDNVVVHAYGAGGVDGG